MGADPRNPCQRRGGGVICARPNGHGGTCTGQSSHDIREQKANGTYKAPQVNAASSARSIAAWKTRRETAEGTMDASVRCGLHLGGTKCRRAAGHTGECTQYNPDSYRAAKTNRGSKYRKLNRGSTNPCTAIRRCPTPAQLLCTLVCFSI